MLEIKIKQVDKVLTTQEKRKEFLLKELTVTEKVDGVRLQLIRNNEDYDADFTKNWIVMYKGFVLYDNEFNNLDTEEIKSYSNGITQYRFIFDLLEKIHPNASSIGKNTEFLFEFIMKKNTLTRQYKKYWDLVLLGYSKITYTEIDGVIRSFPEELNQGN